jgi:hypothetical protein
MRELREIIEAVKDNVDVTEDELKYALVAMSALSYFNTQAFEKLAEGKIKGKTFLSYDPEYQRNEHLERTRKAMCKSPKEWLGENHDFKSKEYQETRKRMKKIFGTIKED